MGFITRKYRTGMILGITALIPAVLFSTRLSKVFRNDPPAEIVVNLSARELSVLEDGEVTHTYGIAVGRPSHPTPTGHFRTGGIDWNPSWTPPPVGWARDKTYQPPGSPDNPMRGVKIYFRAPYYFIHGTNDPGSIGEAASHGCIRMTEGAAVDLAHWIEDHGGSVPMTIED
jgi:lipoprotein-anchoring transpeptidase ErfK/SrfK